MSDQSTATEITSWTPTDTQRLCKAKFWEIIKDHWRPVESYTVVEIAKITESRSVRTWLSKPEFVAWFLNKDTYKHKLVAAQELAVERAVEVLMNTDMGPNGQVTAPAVIRAAEFVMNYSGAAPVKKTEVTAKTNQIQGMDPIQLKQFLSQQMKRLLSSMKPEEIKEVLGAENLERITGEIIDET